MKLSDAEWQWDRKKLTFYFTAEKRVDFRNLVRDLASLFRARIELKQIGVRDEAKMVGGIGSVSDHDCPRIPPGLCQPPRQFAHPGQAHLRKKIEVVLIDCKNGGSLAPQHLQETCGRVLQHGIEYGGGKSMLT